MRLHFFSDPGHGWLIVELVTLVKSGVIDDISSFSFVANAADVNALVGKPVCKAGTIVALLEEDCDAGTYLKTLDRGDLNRVIVEHYSDREYARNHWRITDPDIKTMIDGLKSAVAIVYQPATDWFI